MFGAICHPPGSPRVHAYMSWHGLSMAPHAIACHLAAHATTHSTRPCRMLLHIWHCTPAPHDLCYVTYHHAVPRSAAQHPALLPCTTWCMWGMPLPASIGWYTPVRVGTCRHMSVQAEAWQSFFSVRWWCFMSLHVVHLWHVLRLQYVLSSGRTGCN